MERQQSMQSDAQFYVRENLNPNQTMRGRNCKTSILLQNALCIFKAKQVFQDKNDHPYFPKLTSNGAAPYFCLEVSRNFLAI